MSLLRRLGEQAQQVKDAEAAQERSRQQRKDRYNDLVVPGLQAISVFLSQLTEQLKVVRPTVVQHFEMPGYGRFPTVSLLDYTVRSEPRYSDFIIEVAWKSRVDTEKAPRLALNSFDRIRNIADLFKRFHLGGFKDERKGPTGHVIACTVQASGFISSKLVIQGSLEDDLVRFTFDNVDQLLPTRQAIPMELLSDEVCDRLGEFLLRENDTFIRDSWVRGLKAPVVPLKPVGYDAPAVKPLNAGPDDGKAPLPSAVITAPAFLGASMQRADRDHALMAELSEAAKLAEAAVLQTLGSAEIAQFGSERVLAPVSLAAETTPPVAAPVVRADAITPPITPPAAIVPSTPTQAPALRPPTVAQANAVPAATPAPVVSRPPAAPPAPVVATPPQVPMVTPAARPAPAMTEAAPSPAPPVATPRSVVAPPPAAPPVAAPRPLVVPPSAAPPVVTPRPAVAPPVSAPVPSARTVASVTPSGPPPASPPPVASETANPPPAAQPAAARGFMDRFKKMRADLERE